MSGARTGAGDQGGHTDGLYGDPNPTAGLFDPLEHDDVDSFFFNNRSPCAAGEGGGGGGDGYSSIMDYLQGFLADDGVKQETVGGGGEEQRRGSKNGGPDQEETDGDEGSAADRNCKRSKGEKKARQPRVAFKTKSEVDHLEDGYRWRKYGQKAVKNSSYPRSYYRCTAARCGVKKLVERSQQDPSSVITTYQGQHTHPSPVVGLAGARQTLLLQHQPHSNITISPPLHQHQHQLGFIRPDELASMATSTRAAGMPPASG